MQNPYFKLPVSKHSDVKHAIVDADGVTIGIFGLHGDSDQAGSAIADLVVAALNGETGTSTEVAAEESADPDAKPVRKRSTTTE